MSVERSALERLDSTASETLIRFLAHYFDVRKPKLHITNRHANAGRYISGKRIRVSKNAELWVLLHEFAHHLNRQINGRSSEPHDKVFYWNLLRVIEACGCADYPWSKEYKQLRRWASQVN